MKKEDLKRLNELYKRFQNDDDFKDYERLSHDAWTEYNDAHAERSLLGEVNGNRYILLLPYDELMPCGGEWQYKHHGFDMEIQKPSGAYICLCQSLCNRDAKYFVDRMLKDKAEAERKE